MPFKVTSIKQSLVLKSDFFLVLPSDFPKTVGPSVLTDRNAVGPTINFKSLSDILIKPKTECNAIGSGNWEGINFNRRSFQISMFYRTFGSIYILKSSVLLHFCRFYSTRISAYKGMISLEGGQFSSILLSQCI
jgi:hypothetical protein